MSANKCIECSVKTCTHHCQDVNYCSLDHIQVGTHECSPDQSQCNRLPELQKEIKAKCPGQRWPGHCSVSKKPRRVCARGGK